MKLTSNSNDQPKKSLGDRVGLKKNIYLLPNFITTGALFFGFYAIAAAFNGLIDQAAIAILIAAVFDATDGRVARLTSTTSSFGAHYDSLSDLIAFGLAPGILMMTWGLADLGNFGWICSFVYVACTALRLARFNNQNEDEQNGAYFVGLPSPVAGIIVACAAWTFYDYPLLVNQLPYLSAFVLMTIMLSLSVLMVSEIAYWSPKKLTFRSTKPFFSLVGFAIVFALVATDPSKIGLLLGLLYAILGPLRAIFSWLTRQLLKIIALSPQAKFSDQQSNTKQRYQ